MIKTGITLELVSLFDMSTFTITISVHMCPVHVFIASVVRHIYLRQGVGVGALKKVYGGRKRRGTVPATYVKAAASVHRHILQQLEKLKLLEADSANG